MTKSLTSSNLLRKGLCWLVVCGWSAMSGRGMVWEGEEFSDGAIRNTRLLCSQIDKEHGTHRDYKTSRSALHSSP